MWSGLSGYDERLARTANDAEQLSGPGDVHARWCEPVDAAAGGS